MLSKAFSRLRQRNRWVRAVTLYRRDQYGEFLNLVKDLESDITLSPYQLAMKANGLLLTGNYNDALANFSILSSDISDDDLNTQYVRHYARAMIADINGDTREFSRIAQVASRISCKYIIRLNLPLN